MSDLILLLKMAERVRRWIYPSFLDVCSSMLAVIVSISTLGVMHSKHT